MRAVFLEGYFSLWVRVVIKLISEVIWSITTGQDKIIIVQVVLSAPLRQ